MTAQRMKPRRSERDQHTATRFEQRLHELQRASGIRVVLESVDRQNDVHLVRGFGREDAAIGHAGLSGRASGHLEDAFADIQPDHPLRAVSRDLDRVVSGSASEVEDGLVGELTPDSGTEQHFELAAVPISFARAQVASRRAAAEPPEEPIAEPSADHAHWSVQISGRPRSPNAMRSPASSSTSPTGAPLASITGDTEGAAARGPALGRSRASTRSGRVVAVE